MHAIDGKGYHTTQHPNSHTLLGSKEKHSNFNKDSLPNDNFYRSIGFKYFQLYSSAYNVFKKYPYFGVGNKNYRVITCPEKVEDWNPDYVCNSHPHQIYFEFL